MPQNRRTRWVVALTAAALVMGALGACGDDDDDEEATATTTTEAAPRASDTVDVEYFEMGYRVSGPLVAGGTLQLRNTGAQFHMMGLGRLKPGRTLDDLRKALSEAGPPGGGGPQGGEQPSGQGGTTTSTAGVRAQSQGEEQQDPTADLIDEVGLPGNFMGPGQSAELTVPDFGPGKYALICFLPTEGEGTPHFAKGMLGELEVVGGDAPEPTADATYRATPGKAIEGPATLTAGKHTLKLEAVGPGSEELEPSIARLNPGTSAAQLDRAFQQFEEQLQGETPPPRGIAGQLPGQLVIGTFDFGPTKSFFVSLDFTPGEYVLVAEDSDDEADPSPPRELITIKVT